MAIRELGMTVRRGDSSGLDGRHRLARDDNKQSWLGRLDGAAAGGAKMSGGNGGAAAIRAEMRASRTGDEHHGHARFRGAGPEERDDPADNGPAEEEIHEEDAHSILLVVPNDGGQEVEQYPEREKRHLGILSARRHTYCLPLLDITLESPKMFPRAPNVL